MTSSGGTVLVVEYFLESHIVGGDFGVVERVSRLWGAFPVAEISNGALIALSKA